MSSVSVPTVIRAFLSVDIENEALLARIEYLQRKLDTGAARLKLVEHDNIHFTLRFLGDISEAVAQRMHEELSKVRFSPFNIDIAGVGAFPSVKRPNVVWIGVRSNMDRLEAIKQDIDNRLAEFGLGPERKFAAHATIARVKSITDRVSFEASLRDLSGEVVGTMPVTAFRMTKSTLTPSGPQYETLWEVRGSP
ncbi:MAG: RNA 2',3'-cyclic phosphodiesterase [Candidatus Thorarchaeota archaeon]|nr:RNA 2',3'-cyclic phosphodiesterase [Candidatus Thorarchaeota archaeon]